MGWLFTGQTREQLIRDLNRTEENDRRVMSFIQNHYDERESVLWHVIRVTAKKPIYFRGEKLRTGECGFLITCDLLEQGEKGWGYKCLTELDEPCFYSCPLEYLKKVPVASDAWRKKVREYHARQARDFLHSHVVFQRVH